MADLLFQKVRYRLPVVVLKSRRDLVDFIITHPHGRGPGESFPVVQGSHHPGQDYTGVVIGHAKVCCCLQRLLDISGFTGSFGYGGFQDGFLVGERA